EATAATCRRRGDPRHVRVRVDPAVLLASPFLLHRARHPARLHPFPTRRSSDLHGAASSPPARRPARVVPRSPGGTPGDRGTTLADRKSTRLNSSHDQISYAVFCLKKKTHGESRTTPANALPSPQISINKTCNPS